MPLFTHDERDAVVQLPPPWPEGYRPPCIDCHCYFVQRMSDELDTTFEVPAEFCNLWQVHVRVWGEFCPTSVVFNAHDAPKTEGAVPMYTEERLECYEPEPGVAGTNRILVAELTSVGFHWLLPVFRGREVPPKEPTYPFQRQLIKVALCFVDVSDLE